MNRFLDFISDFFFPNRCPACDEFIPWDRLFCEKCESELETASFCPRCGHDICSCGERPFEYDGCATAAPYTGHAREGVLALKYQSGFNTAKYYNHRLCAMLKELGFSDGADLVTAVPMSASRRRLTGYNHAEYIAGLISKSLGVPKDFRLIKADSSEISQHSLSASEREIAAKVKYHPARRHKDITGSKVILCDDIITTGSTLSECASVLKRMGVQKVYCAVICGTLLKNPGVEEVK